MDRKTLDYKERDTRMYIKKCVERFKQKILRNKNRERCLSLRENGTPENFLDCSLGGRKKFHTLGDGARNVYTKEERDTNH
jgi:hypothetical protein